jgi:hypothetical protein
LVDRHPRQKSPEHQRDDSDARRHNDVDDASAVSTSVDDSHEPALMKPIGRHTAEDQREEVGADRV